MIKNKNNLLIKKYFIDYIETNNHILYKKNNEL